MSGADDTKDNKAVSSQTQVSAKKRKRPYGPADVPYLFLEHSSAHTQAKLDMNSGAESELISKEDIKFSCLLPE